MLKKYCRLFFIACVLDLQPKSFIKERKMKIAYILSHDISTNDGVVRKIIDQTNAWGDLGVDVEVFAITPNANVENNSILKCKAYDFQGAIQSRLKVNYQLIEDVKNFNPDFIYFRYDLWSRNIEILSRMYPIVIEANTNDYKEVKLQIKSNFGFKSLLRLAAKLLSHKRLLKLATGVVSVTQEIYEDSGYTDYIKSHAVVPNGISLNNYIAYKKTFSGDRPALFFIGSPNQAWHGVDKIEVMAKKLPEFDFHIVGLNGESTKNCFYYGYLNKEKYQPLINKCCVALGTLALERKGLKEACPLKVREYLMNGLPIIIGYEDPALANNPGWGLVINELDEQTVSKIRTFVFEHINFHVPLDELDVIDTQVLEKERVDYFMTVMKNVGKKND
jgi:glycosyltransferase involved in cell wall biosynthesis